MNPWKIRKFLSERVAAVSEPVAPIWQLEVIFNGYTRYVPNVAIMSDAQKQAEIRDGKIKLWWLPLHLQVAGMWGRCDDPDNISFIKWLHEWVYEPQKPTTATLWKWVGDDPVELWVMSQAALSAVNTDYQKDTVDLYLTFKDINRRNLETYE